MKQHMKKLAARFGIEIRRRTFAGSEGLRLNKFLSDHNVDFVVDVGANEGQYARRLREHGYEGRILSFEPLSSAYSHLVVAAKDDPRWRASPRMAIGDHDAELEINISQNSFSSSILPMLSAHEHGAPESVYVGKERVPVRRLDGLWGTEIPVDAKSYFLKVDVQGYEHQVLDGAPQLLSHVQGLQLELSIVPLYDGQALYDQLIDRLRKLGFELFAVFPGFVDPASGRSLQFDGVFFR